MNKLIQSLVSSFLVVVLMFASAGNVFAKDITTNAEKAKDLLIEQGYTEEEAVQDLKNMAVLSEGTLVGIDVLAPSEPKINSPFRAAPLTSTQYLSHDQVKVIFDNLNMVGDGSTLLGTLFGLYNPVLGAVIGLGGMQNRNLRNAITQAYYQGKRVKIVTEFGASSSLNKVYYYVVN